TMEGNFSTLLNGLSAVPSSDNGLRHGYRSPSGVLARRVAQKHGKVIDVPKIWSGVQNRKQTKSTFQTDCMSNGGRGHELK
ncbi:MAG: hypothetical protein M3M88_02260, partial [Thermoproteota archaeon]|nr:hypothetical protein [Thermoproteota archaeon]